MPTRIPDNNVGPEPILRMEGISKQRSLDGVWALRGVDLELRPREVLALVAEKGAGKSTLVELLCGNVRADHGRILYQGRPVHFAGAMEAAFARISSVHQELSLVPYLSVAESICCAREPLIPNLGFVDRRRLYPEAEEILRRFDLDVPPQHPGPWSSRRGAAEDRDRQGTFPGPPDAGPRPAHQCHHRPTDPLSFRHHGPTPRPRGPHHLHLPQAGRTASSMATSASPATPQSPTSP